MLDLTACFDVVVMLTWSDWETEPRSNRYHYATRFAKYLPVLFVQNQRSKVADKTCLAGSGFENVDLVDVCAPISKNQVSDLLTLIQQRGFRRPLIWIYDCLNYRPLLDSMPGAFRVYHATEDYFTYEAEVGDGHIHLREQLKMLLQEMDLVVAVTDKVCENIVSGGNYCGPTITAENGCDFQFFEELKNGLEENARSEKPVVIYQGGVNYRLDCELICSITREMPDFEFRFFGRILETDDIRRLREIDNLRLFGSVSPDVFGREMLRAAVGIVPFQQTELMRNSLPLKVFEYVACGLPVVSIPIHALEKYGHHDDIIRFARTDDEFVSAIRDLAAVRHDSERIARAEALAKLNSYDARFAGVAAGIVDIAVARARSDSPLNVAMLYDPESCHVGTVREHLNSFRRHSSHSYVFLPATNLWGQQNVIEGVGAIDLSIFDAVIVHYCVRLSSQNHLVENVAIALEKFHGLKVLFIQDEYDAVECTRRWMDRLGFDLVYTCVPLGERDKVYPSFRYPATEFLPTLTGYVPESVELDLVAKPLESRTFVFVYRGRELPPVYGKLGHEKYLIGVETARRAKALGLPVDIACDADSRIYGDDWYRFLASGRATLGTESGSNVFDFYGLLADEIDALRTRHPGLSFEEVWERLIKPHDGFVRMNQISPKIFEAIRLRTALVLFEGDYSGVVKPDIHFIPLKKDFSNFEEVVAKVMDDNLIREMTERAYQDVIASGQYSYRSFVEGVDRDLRERCLRRRPRRVMYGAVYVEEKDGAFRQCLPAIPLGLPCAADVLANRIAFQKIQEMHAQAAYADPGAVTRRDVQLKDLVVHYGVTVANALKDIIIRQPHALRGARWVYKRLPESVRAKVKEGLKGG